MMGQVSMPQSVTAYPQVEDRDSRTTTGTSGAPVIEQSVLPDSLLTQAFRTHDGEYAWRRSDLPGVVRALAEQRLAVICGEVWLVEGNLVSCLSPCKNGGWAVIAWDNRSLETGESWDHYVANTVEETLHAIEELNAEESVRPDVADKLFYHVWYSDEKGYSEFKAKVA